MKITCSSLTDDYCIHPINSMSNVFGHVFSVIAINICFPIHSYECLVSWQSDDLLHPKLMHYMVGRMNLNYLPQSFFEWIIQLPCKLQDD